MSFRDKLAVVEADKPCNADPLIEAVKAIPPGDRYAAVATSIQQ